MKVLPTVYLINQLTERSETHHTLLSMAHHDVIESRYKEFNPGTKWLEDKRVYERAVGGFKSLVAKNYANLGIPCVAMYPDVEKGKFVGVKFATPEGPLKNHFETAENQKKYFDLMQEAFLDALARKEEKKEGVDVNPIATETRLIGFSEPPRPVWVLTVKELETYFTTMKTQLARVDNIKMKRKWPKIENGVAIKLPTKVPMLDKVCEQILPSNLFIPGQKFAPGNLLWRLKLVCAYIMLKNGKDPNTFANDVPADFEGKNYSLKDLEGLGNELDISASAKEGPAGSSRAQNVSEIDHNASAPVNNASDDSSEPIADSIDSPIPVSDQDQSSQSEGSRSTQKPGCSRSQPLGPRCSKELKSPGLVSISQPVPENVFIELDDNLDLDNSRDTGTPVQSDDDDYEALARADELERKMNLTSIENLLGGIDCHNAILQVYNFEEVQRGKFFRAYGQNCKLATTKIAFSNNLNSRVEELYGKLPVIKIHSYELYNGSFVVVKDFEVLEIFDYVLGSPVFLTNEDYQRIKSSLKPKENQAQTPSLVKKVLSERHVTEVNTAQKSSSRFNKNRSMGH